MSRLRAWWDKQPPKVVGVYAFTSALPLLFLARGLASVVVPCSIILAAYGVVVFVKAAREE